MKLTLRILLGILFTLLLLLVLAITPLANPIWKLVANHVVEPLSITSIEGDIRRGMIISGVAWRSETESARIEHVSFTPKWSCLFDKTVCVENLSATGIHITVPDTNNAPTTSDSDPLQPISLPVAIVISTIDIKDISVETPAIRLQLERFKTRVEADSNVRITEPTFDGLVLTQLEQSSPPKTSSETSSFSLTYTPPTLPTVVLPIGVSVTQLQISPLVLNQGEAKYHINTISLASLIADQSNVELQQFKVDDELGELLLSSEVTLANQYPLSLDVMSTVNTPALPKPLTLTINGQGDASALSIRAHSKGYIPSTLLLKADMLDETLPLELDASWQAFSIEGDTPIAIEQGGIEIAGQIGSYAVNAQTGATLDPVGRSTFLLKAAVAKDKINIDSLDIEALNGTLSTSGTVFLKDTISWAGTSQLSTLDLTPIHSHVPTDLTGSIDVRMRLTDKGPDINATSIQIDGQYLDLPISIVGQGLYSSNSDILVTTLDIAHDKNNVSTVTQIFNQRYIKSFAHVDVTSLTAINPEIQGTVEGQVHVSGEWQNPIFEIDLAAKQVSVSESLNYRAAEQGPMDVKLLLSGSVNEHKSQITLDAKDLGYALSVQGEYNDKAWAGVIANGETRIYDSFWRLNNEAKLSVNIETFASSIASHCWVEATKGRVCFGESTYQDGEARWQFEAAHIPIGKWLYRLFPNTLSSDSGGELRITSNGRYQTDASVTADFELDISPSTWQVGPNNGVDIVLDELNGTATLENNQLAHHFALVSPQLGEIRFDGQVSNISDSPAMNSQLVLDGIDLAPLSVLNDTLEHLEGQISGQLLLSDSVTKPQINGHLALQNGRIESPALPTQISKWEQSFLFKGDAAEFDGQFVLGEGIGGLDGKVDWSDSPFLNLHLTGDEFAFRQKDVRLKLSPNLTANITPEDINVSGEIDIPWARVEIEGLPDSAVSPSRDVHLHGEKPSEDPLRRIDANVNIVIDKKQKGEVKLDAFGLTANLGGNLKVATQPAVTAFGDLSINDGRYQAYGQNLMIRTGEIQFNGPVGQPLLLIEAIRDPDDTEDDVIAGVRIDGPATRPNVGLFSEPAMDQGANLAYLLNGSAGLGGGGGEMNQEAYAGILLGLGLSNTESLTGKVGEALGIDDFSLSTSGQGANTKLEVSGKIADDLTIRYGVGVFNSGDTGAPEVALRYQLADNLYIEAIQGLYQALDMYYQFSLGKNTPPESSSEN